MKLSFGTNEVVQSEPLEQHEFSIGDEGVIQWLLRDKLYNNPIRVIAQEYCSNARDAHREVNKHAVPITVILPTTLEPCLKVIDQGPGISPERMVDVFLKFGSSTKRKNNKQNGGFGIGAKSAFAYTTSFVVTTTVDKVKRVYNAYLNEEKKAAMSLTDTMQCDEENGTTITIPIEPKDIEQFSKWVYFCTSLWEVPPSIVNAREEHHAQYRIGAQNKLLQGVNWYITESALIQDQQAVALVDGIPYPIVREQLGEIPGDVSDFLDECHSVLIYKVGEIEVSASREALNYTDETRRAVIKRVNQLRQELKTTVEQTIKNEPTYFAACCRFADVIREVGSSTIFGKEKNNILWNNIAVKDDLEVWFEKNNKGHTVADMMVYERGEKRGERSNNIAFSGSLLIARGEPKRKFVRSKVETLFKENPSIRRVAVVYPEKDVNSSNYAVAVDWDKEVFTQLTPRDMEQVVGVRQPRTKGTAVRRSSSAIAWLCAGDYNGKNYLGKQYTELAELDAGGFYAVKSGAQHQILKGVDKDGQLEYTLGTRDELCESIRRFLINKLLANTDFDKFRFHIVRPNIVPKLNNKWKNIWEIAREKVNEWGAKEPGALAIGWHLHKNLNSYNNNANLCNLCNSVAIQKIGLAMDASTFLGSVGRIYKLYEASRRQCETYFRLWSLFNPTAVPTVVDEMTTIIDKMKEAKKRYPLFAALVDYADNNVWKDKTVLADLTKYVESRDLEFATPIEGKANG